MYGETHVDPIALFDPERGRPPSDAVDLFFPAPLSLSLLGDAFAAHGMQRELDQLLDFYAGLARGIVTDVQRQGGYVTGGHRGRPIPARLEITALAEDAVPGTSTMRLHTHVYVGRTAAALETGERHTIDLTRLHRAADRAWTNYFVRLVEDSTRELGLTWAPLPGHSSGDVEIVNPPLAEHTVGHVIGVCPGSYGVHDQIRADAQWREDVQENSRLIAAERHRSTG